MTSAAALTLDNSFATEFDELCVPWQAQQPPDPALLVLNEPLAAELGLDPDWLRSPAGIGLLTGTDVPAGATPVAQAYSGHQFGGFSPLLGDGRALLLGEVTDTTGRLRDIALKGSGRTPFARGGDGLAVVGPMLREYLISEAMHALGIPTTRSLAVVATGGKVTREGAQPGAVLTRVAASHLRVGSFQYAAAREHAKGETGLVRRLADYAIARHHPAAADSDQPYLALLDAVADVQARLIAQWMAVGFIHGVMNTDNMTISGETIDYGPCAFMDAYDPATVFSSIDHAGRYAYGNQPAIAQWNLARFAETLLPLLDSEDSERAVGIATEALNRFAGRYADERVTAMRAKLGLAHEVSDEDVTALTDDLLAVMQRNHTDYTSYLRSLGAAAHGGASSVITAAGEGFADWLARWRAMSPDGAAMDRANPIYIPRNHLVEHALGAATDGDLAPLDELLDVLRDPYTAQPGRERYAQPAPTEFADGYRTFCGT